jgi:hypothetical protein
MMIAVLYPRAIKAAVTIRPPSASSAGSDVT